MSEYQIKLEALREYEDVLRLKKVFEEGIELESSLLREIIAYYGKVGLEIPERRKVLEFMSRLLALASPEVKRGQKSPEDEALPFAPWERLI